jgi:hypothetical protein
VARKAGGGCLVIQVVGEAPPVAIRRPSLSGPLSSLSGAGAGAGAIHCRCGGVGARRRVVLILALAWFVVVARWVGYRRRCGVARRCLLAPTIHPASSCSQGW